MKLRSIAKTVAALALPVLLGGCLTDEQINSLAQAAQASQRPQGVTSGYRPQTSYNPQYAVPGYRPPIPVAPQYQGAYVDGYRRGYKTGFRDGGHGAPYARTASYGHAPEAYGSGYGQGYSEGYNEARRGIVYGCSL